MEILQLEIFINQNLAISLVQDDDLIEITPDMVQQVCDELQKLKTEIKTRGKNG